MKAEKESNVNGKNQNKNSNSNLNNKSHKVKFNLIHNEVWEVERVPSIEKDNFW